MDAGGSSRDGYATRNAPPDKKLLSSNIRSSLSNVIANDDDMDFPKISVNKPVDVIALLSGLDLKRDYLINSASERVPVDSLRGKYVLICRFLIPLLDDSLTNDFHRAVIALISELPQTDSDKLQVVIVPKFRTGIEPFELGMDFLEFFSTFPRNCLSIPPLDFVSCDYLWKSINLVPIGGIETGEMAVFIDPQQMVLQHGQMSCALRSYGAAGFPFTETRLFKDLDLEGEILKRRLDSVYKEYNPFSLKRLGPENLDKLSSVPVSLEELLECRTLFNIQDQEREVTLSYFSGKLVGLYIYFDGHFMEELGEVLCDCHRAGRPFEIVVIRLSSQGEPSSILQQVLLELKEHEISPSNWWTFAFNYKVCQKLWRICDFDDVDKLIIVPPPGDKNRSGDLQGKAVIREHGGFSAYPFTRETILERKLSALSSITLESLLKEYDHLVCNEDVNSFSSGEEGGDRKMWRVADLRGKRILLYFDDLENKFHKSGLYDKVRLQYSEMKAEYPGSEVVFAPSFRSSTYPKCKGVSEMPWLKVPFFSPSLMEQLHLRGIRCCVAFGKDGRLLSRKANLRLHKIASLFDDDLRREIVEELHRLNQDID